MLADDALLRLIRGRQELGGRREPGGRGPAWGGTEPGRGGTRAWGRGRERAWGGRVLKTK